MIQFILYICGPTHMSHLGQGSQVIDAVPSTAGGVALECGYWCGWLVNTDKIWELALHLKYHVKKHCLLQMFIAEISLKPWVTCCCNGIFSLFIVFGKPWLEALQDIFGKLGGWTLASHKRLLNCLSSIQERVIGDNVTFLWPQTSFVELGSSSFTNQKQSSNLVKWGLALMHWRSQVRGKQLFYECDPP